LINKERSKH